MLPGFVTAVRTLTIFPIPGRESSNYAAALPYFPVVGGMLGVLLWALASANRLLPGAGWSQGVAALMLVVSVISTRALHLDGLADLADGWGGSRDRKRWLEIMKDPGLGAFGGVSLILVLLCKWLAFTRLVTWGGGAWVVLILTISRTMQVKLAVNLPYARSEEGTALPFVRDARGSHRVAALGITMLVALPFGPLGVGALAVAELMTSAYGSWCRKHLGGITGDLLGAANELVETLLLLLIAASGFSTSGYSGWDWLLP